MPTPIYGAMGIDSNHKINENRAYEIVKFHKT